MSRQVLLELVWRESQGETNASLHYVAKQTLTHVILWKFSEAFSTHKILGCPFWTEAAFAALRRYGEVRTPGSLKKRGLPESEGLQHEHVCERAVLADRLLGEARPHLSTDGITVDRDALAESLTRLAVGCVITFGEHHGAEGLEYRSSDFANPWKRYARAPKGIRVVQHGKIIRGNAAPLTDEAVLDVHARLLEEAAMLTMKAV